LIFLNDRRDTPVLSDVGLPKSPNDHRGTTFKKEEEKPHGTGQLSYKEDGKSFAKV